MGSRAHEVALIAVDGVAWIDALRAAAADERICAVVLLFDPGPRQVFASAAIEACGKPVVAALAGELPAAAYQLALACDARVALADATLSTSIGAMEAVGQGLIDAVVEGDLSVGATDLALAWGRAGRKRHTAGSMQQT